MLQEGFQSWSFSGATVVPLAVPLGGDGEPAFAAASTGQPEDEVVGVSYGVAAIADDDAHAVVIGATSAARATTGIAATALDAHSSRVTLVYGAAREPLASDAQGAVRSEWIYVGAGGVNATLGALREEISADLPADAQTAKRPPGGWYSWNARFDSIDASYVRAAAEKAKAVLLPAGMPLIEIDDGWERAWGDWQTKDSFGATVETLAGELVAQGLVPGVWLAPFLVDVTSETGKTIDRSLLVRGPDGEPIVHTPNGNSRKLYVLDGTSPRAMAIATDAIARLAAAGVRFFKLDFLYAGAFVGSRAEQVTGTEALRRGLALLRKAAGSGAFINACGAPVLPSLGEVDSLRVGADTAFSGLNLTWPFVAFATRNLAARAWLAPVVWPDFDQALLRPPYTMDEARVAATMAALAGPAYSLGDDLTALDPSRLALGIDPDVVDLSRADAPATAEGIFASPATEVAWNPVWDAIKGHGDTYSAPPARFHAVGKSGRSRTITVTWTGAHALTIE